MQLETHPHHVNITVMNVLLQGSITGKWGVNSC